MPLSVPASFPVDPEALRLLESATNPSDVLRRLIRDRSISPFLLTAGVDPVALGSVVAGSADADGPQPERKQRVLDDAIREAQLLGHRRVGLLHVLMALLYADSPDTAKPLSDAGLTLYDLRTYVHSAEGQRERDRLSRAPLPRLRGEVRPSPYFLLPLGGWALGALILLTHPIDLPDLLGTLVFVLGGWITSVCLHEFAHAVVAYYGGDRAVAQAGYLSLNPRRYSHPLFTIVLPVVFIILGGIGLPGGAVYINRQSLRSRGWDAAVSAAGPFASLCFTLLVAIPFATLGPAKMWAAQPQLTEALAYLGVLVLASVILNLLPIPPLDGWGIVSSFMSWETRARIGNFGSIGVLILFLLLWQTRVGNFFWELVYNLAALLQMPPVLAYLGQQAMQLSRLFQI